VATRNRIDVHDKRRIESVLKQVLRHSVAFAKCPLDDEETTGIWNYGFPDEIMASMRVLSDGKYLDIERYTEQQAQAVIPRLGVGVRFALLNRHGDRRYMDWPQGGPHKRALHKYGGTDFRHIEWEAIEAVLPDKEKQDAFVEWCHTAAKISDDHLKAYKTISDVLGMLTTAGQLKRMVPELVLYLDASSQYNLSEQTRASPFPEKWAEYPKDRIEQLLAALAQGHLLKGLGKFDPNGTSFSWAQYIPGLKTTGVIPDGGEDF
jgi:hypothetical protein